MKELAEKYGQDVMTMVGFLDGINDSLVIPNPIETMTEDTEVSLGFDKERLYKNMVDAKADWLYGLPQWKQFLMRRRENVFTESRKHPERSASRKKSAEMIRVPVAVERNIKSAVEEMHR